MKISNLYKIEIYRFFHSFLFFVCMVIGFISILFLASDHSDALLGDGTPVGIVASTMQMTNLIIVLLVSITVSGYIGREFKQKTLNYEIMSGYNLWKISLIKTATCGIFIPIMLQLCILGFLTTIPGALQIYSFRNIFFMFILLIHICSCTVLYVMLCRSGTLGGCLAFARFTLIEVVVIFASELFLPGNIYNKCLELSIMSQWNAVTNTDLIMPGEYMISIVAGALAEYIILLAVIQICSKKTDF